MTHRLGVDAFDVLLSWRASVCVSRCRTLRSWYHIKLNGARSNVHMMTQPCPNPVGSSWSFIWVCSL